MSKDEITLGSIQDLSGPLTGFGKQARLGMMLAVDEINRLAEAEAIVVGKTNGARLIGTTHGATILGLLANKNLTPLFDPEPVFHWLVITERRGQYRVYRAAEAVVAVRAGRVPEGEVVYV